MIDSCYNPNNDSDESDAAIFYDNLSLLDIPPPQKINVLIIGEDINA